MKMGWWIVTLLSCILVTPASAQTPSNPPPPPVASDPDFPRGKISGLVFGDAYYNVTGDPNHVYTSGADALPANLDGSSPSASSPAAQPKLIGKDLNGLQIRRVYFQLDNDLSIRVATRFRLEADSRELTSGGKIGVFVKAAYVQVKDLLPRGNLLVGMTNTPTFENSEEFWGYRAVEKTIVDFRGLGPSSDLGLNLKGFFDGGHRIGYSGMIGDGTGQKPENNRYKRMYLAVPLRLIEDLRIEPYVDYEDFAGNADRALYKLFLGYELKRAAIGAEILDQVVHVDGARNREPFGISVFGRAHASDRLSAFARYDRWQPDTRAANRIDSDLYIAGLDWEPIKDLHFMPNVEATGYRARGTADAPPHHDLQARITFYYRFSKP
ncbi:MAG TPA: hypothetical protein VFT93_02300 [Candidatus Eisenbacteria bacterium]|nr:hypothetical protein [Candidatus Eisenbacteria bacterium]